MTLYTWSQLCAIPWKLLYLRIWPRRHPHRRWYSTWRGGWCNVFGIVQRIRSLFGDGGVWIYAFVWWPIRPVRETRSVAARPWRFQGRGPIEARHTAGLTQSGTERALGCHTTHLWNGQITQRFILPTTGHRCVGDSDDEKVVLLVFSVFFAYFCVILCQSNRVSCALPCILNRACHFWDFAFLWLARGGEYFVNLLRDLHINGFRKTNKTFKQKLTTLLSALLPHSRSRFWRLCVAI